MKNIKYIVLSLLLFTGLTACEVDNYEGPKETFKGKFIDKGTQEPFQTAAGGFGIRLRMYEYSWSDTPTPYDMYTMQDGTFNNTKIFKGEYGVIPEGAFVPLTEERFNIAGVTEKVYEVEPFLRIEWVGEPVFNGDGTFSVKIKLSRGTTNPAYQQQLNDIWLCVCETSSVDVSSAHYSSYLTTKYTAAQIAANINMTDFTITLRSGQPSGPGSTQNLLPTYERKYFIRAAARVNLAVIGSNSIFNYSTMKEITNPAR